VRTWVNLSAERGQAGASQENHGEGERTAHKRNGVTEADRLRISCKARPPAPVLQESDGHALAASCAC
jgi:hypothetical protein